MTSTMPRGARQVSLDNEYYITIGNCLNRIYSLNTTTGASTFVAAPWASTTITAPASCGPLGTFMSSANLLTGAGTGLLKDMGKTYISAGRTFRRVQLVVPQAATVAVFGTGATVSTFGVGGQVNTAPLTSDYFTGYIETSFDLASSGPTGPTPVAKWGR